MEIQKEYGPFSKFIWNYLKGKQIVNQFHKKKGRACNFNSVR